MELHTLLHTKQLTLPKVEILTLAEFQQRPEMVNSLSKIAGLDYEATGYDYLEDDFYIRTVGLANDDYCVSIDLLDACPVLLERFKKWLIKVPYVAHNAQFEAGATMRWAGDYGIIAADTLILFKDLATEHSRNYGLEYAISDLLGLTKQGDLIADLMKENKYTWKDIRKFDIQALGYYNAIDAYGTWELYKLFKEVTESYSETWGPYYWDYHTEDIYTCLKLQHEARQEGIYVDEAALQLTIQETRDKQEQALHDFLNQEQIKPFIEEYNHTMLRGIEDKEPPKFTKKGDITVRWSKWEEKVEEARSTNFFNTNSTQQLSWLLFDCLRMTPIEFTETGAPSTSKKCLKKMGIYGKLLLDYRKLTTVLGFLSQVEQGSNNGIIRPWVKMFATISTRSGAGIG